MEPYPRGNKIHFKKVNPSILSYLNIAFPYYPLRELTPTPLFR